jgi:hypothetical protein
MSHAALVNDVVFWLVAFLTLLLVMFIGAVIWMPLGPPPPLHRPYTQRRGPPPPSPARRPPGWLGINDHLKRAAVVIVPGEELPRTQEFCRPGG